MKFRRWQCVDICWHTVLLACVPQFDTMHSSMSLGAFFNDRNFAKEIPLVLTI